MEEPPARRCANCLVKMRSDCSSCCSDQNQVTCSGCSVVQYCCQVCLADHEPSHQAICNVFSGKINLRAGQTAAPKWKDQKRAEELRIKSNTLERLYWQKFGYFSEEDPDNPRHRQCPYQLGEYNGKFVGWIDEYLSHLEEMLTTAIRASSRRWSKNPRVLKHYQELQAVFLDLRSWSWFYESLVKKETPDMVEVLFAEVLFASRDNSAYEILDNYMQGTGFQALSYWETFLDFVGRFHKRVRMAKYSIINLDTIPKNKLGRFSRIIQYCKSSIDYYEATMGQRLPCMKCINGKKTFVPLPPLTQCVGCGLHLSGREAQTQLQFPFLPWLTSQPALSVRFPASPVIHDNVGWPWITSCGDKEKCLRSGVAHQLQRYSKESFSFIKFLSRSEQCNGCLRYSVKTHKCSGCLSVRYCSEECLAQDWSNHREPCRILRQTQASALGKKDRNKSQATSQDLLVKLDPYLNPFWDKDLDTLTEKDRSIKNFLKLTADLKIKK